MISTKKQALLALTYFLLLALLGLSLRLFFVTPLNINYKHIVHTHSHIALLGWVYIGITCLLFKLFLNNQALKKKYSILFWSTQITIIGMLITFPFQGYAALSILFSTLFLICSYWFCWFFLTKTPIESKKTASFKLIKASLWYLILSSIGPWLLGIIINTLGHNSIWYKNAIYFYLHFLYNGFFILALIGIFLKILENHNISMAKKYIRPFLHTINASIVLTLAQSFLWSNTSIVLYIISAIGNLAQIISFLLLIKLCVTEKTKSLFSKVTWNLLQLCFILLYIKAALQLISSFPYFSKLANNNIDFIIGYLHWTFLGIISISILSFLKHLNIIKISKTSIFLYLIGFFTSEALIFYKGIMVWQQLSIFNNYYFYLFAISSLIPISLLPLIFTNIKKPTS